MRTLKKRRGITLVLGLSLLGVAGLVAMFTSAKPGPRLVVPEGVRTAQVRRADIQVTLTAGGTIDSAERTLIECEAERMSFNNEGRTISAGGNLAIISLVPEGTDVAEGDVLCELDSSEYVEIVEQQQRVVEQARTDYRTAELRLQTAEASLREFQEGLKSQAEQAYEGDIVLAESNLETAIDRLNFSERMFGFGYTAPTKLATDRLTRLRAEESVKVARRALDIYRRYEVPKLVLRLEGEVDVARSHLAYQRLRFTRHEDRRKLFQKQVDLCTVRAPHDGFVVYANEDDDDTRVEQGSVVKTKQDLFYLPDLAHMQVQALIHESIYESVKPGMAARIHVAALSDRDIEGRVLSVDPLPYRPKDMNVNPDVKNFVARIDLHATPDTLRPGMSAAVEILSAERAGALVVPTEAVVTKDGEDFCYVAGADGIEKRAVTIASGTATLLCVQSGLEEGDEVILDPERVRGQFETRQDSDNSPDE